MNNDNTKINNKTTLDKLSDALRKNLRRRKMSNDKETNNLQKNSSGALKKVSVALLLMILSSCTSHKYSNGYLVDPENLAKIKQRKTPEDEVKNLLGNPVTTSLYGEKKYFYMKREYEQKLFFAPKLIKQEVLAISFDNSGLVSKIEKFGTNDAIEIKYDPLTTPFEGNKISPFEQILSNFGKFSSQAQKAKR